MTTLRIAMALAVAGVGLSFIAATPTPTPVPTIAVEAQVNDPFPSSGDAVTLTASASGPSGATYSYQWQRKSGASWQSISGATSATLSQTYSTRGTRIYRVRATSGSMSATSDEVMPTWDSTKIVVDMLTAMERRVTALSAYTTAETAFLNCVQRRTGTRRASFDAVLERYASRTKTAVDACETSGAPRSGALPALSATTMFTTYQRLSKQELAAMRRTSAEYNLLLSTDLGLEFLELVSSPEIVKRYAVYLAQGSGVSGQASATGFNCIPRTNPTASQLNLKLEALDCLIFDTRHSWWRTNGATLENRVKNPTSWPRYEFLGTAADICTKFFDGPVPSCRKHDIAVGSLQEFEGTDDANELDAAWNPVNKYLADAKLRRDVNQYDCEDYEGAGAEFVCGVTSASTTASIYFWGVAIRNHKNWIITIQDIERGDYGLDTFYSPSFINCASPHLPRVRNLRITKSGGNFAAQWNFEAGCVVGINDIKFVFTSRSRARTDQQLLDSRILGNLCVSTNNQIACSHAFRSLSPPWEVTSVSVEVMPKEKRYGVENFYPGRIVARVLHGGSS